MARIQRDNATSVTSRRFARTFPSERHRFTRRASSERAIAAWRSGRIASSIPDDLRYVGAVHYSLSPPMKFQASWPLRAGVRNDERCCTPSDARTEFRTEQAAIKREDASVFVHQLARLTLGKLLAVARI